MLLLALCGLASAADDTLFVGNSYTFVNDLDVATAGVLAGLGWTPETERLAEPGWRWADHLAATETDGAWKDALVDPGSAWEVVVLQEQSQIPGFPEDEPDWQESLASLGGLHALADDRGGETVLLMTWGRLDGDDQNRDLYPDYATMQARLTDGYLAYAAQTGGSKVFVAPAGLAWARVHDDDADFAAMYQGDGSHPTPDGTFLTACVIGATLTGRSPVGVLVPPNVDPERGAYLEQVAADVVLGDPFGAVPLPFAHDFADWTGDVAGEHVVPWVQVTDERAVDAVTVGGVAPGHLWVASTGSLSAATITVGDGGELRVAGRLGFDAFVGTLTQDAGVVALDGPATLSGDYAASADAVLELADGATLQVGGQAIPARVDATSFTQGATALTASAIDATSAVVDVPDGWTWRIDDADGGQRLVVGPPSEDGAGTGGGGRGCACDAGGAPSPYWALVLLALTAYRPAVARRRQRDAGGHV